MQLKKGHSISAILILVYINLYISLLDSMALQMDIWKRIIKLLTPVYPRAVYTWGAVLWAVVHDKPMVYEQEEVADAIVMRHGLMEKN